MNRLFQPLTIFFAILAVCCLSRSAPEVVAQGSPAVKVAPVALPDWFLQNRVQLHSDIMLIRLGQSLGVAESTRRLARLGAGVFTCHLDQTRSPGWTPEQDALFRQFVESFHASKIRFIAYSHLLQVRAARAEAARDPRVARTLSGEPAEFPSRREVPRESYWLDITDPGVSKQVLDRFLALAALGVDGFFLDGTQLPPAGTFGTALQQAYLRESGRPLPRAAEPANPDYMAYLKFQARALDRTLNDIMATVRSRFPRLFFIVSVQGYAAPLNYSDPGSYVARLDVVKSEYMFPANPGLNYQVFRKYGATAPPGDVMLAFGWSLLRDTTDDRPPHIWNAAYDTTQETMVFVETLTSYGAIANLHIDGKVLIAPEPEFARVVPMYQRAFGFGKAISPYLTGPPEKYLGIAFSEGARDAHGGDFRAAWDRVVGPCLAVFEAAQREGVPVGILPDARFDEEHLRQFRILFVPSLSQLSADQLSLVKKFQSGGGRLIEGSSPEWAVVGYNPARLPALREKIRTQCGQAPVALQPGYGGKVHLVAYRDPARKRVLLTLNNDFTWLSRRNREAGPRVGPATGVAVTVRGLPVARATDLFSKAPVEVVSTPDGASVRVGTVQQGRFIVLELER